MLTRSRIPPYVALIPVFAGVFVAADDQTVIVTILPQVMLDMKIPVSALDRASWTITGYLLGYVAAMPLLGRLSDTWGHRRLYILSLLLFMGASAAVALSPNLPAWFPAEPFPTLVASRILQAVGAGAMLPISIAIMGDLFPPERRGVPMGLMGASAEAGGVIGPLWGGLIIRYLDWPWVFWINIPLGVLVLVGVLLLLRPNPRRPARVDYLGGALIVVSLAALTLGLARVDSPDRIMALYFAVFALSSTLLIIRQRTATEALLARSMFRGWPFRAARGALIVVSLAALTLGLAHVDSHDQIMGLYFAVFALSSTLLIIRQRTATEALLARSMFRGWPFRAVKGALIVVSLVALTLGLAHVDSHDQIMGLYFAVFALSSTLLIKRQRTATEALLPRSMFRGWPFRAANFTHVLVGGALIIGMVTVPLMANTILGLTPLEGGLLLVRMTAGIPVGAIIGGLACQRTDFRVPTIAGLALAAVGFLFMSSWGLDVADPAMTIHLVITGVGFGLLIAPIALAATNTVEEIHRGTAAAVVTATRLVGMTLGLAALTAWGSARFDGLVAGIQLPFALPGETAVQSQQRALEFGTQVNEAGLTLFTNFFLVAMVLCLIAMVPAAAMAWRRDRVNI